MDFCRQRPAGLGSYTIFGHSITLPTACTIDTVLVPLPTIALIIALVLAKRLRLFNSSICHGCGHYYPNIAGKSLPALVDEKLQLSYGYQSESSTQFTPKSVAAKKEQPQTPKWLKYYLYVALLFLSYKLCREITLRVRANQGLGFLPMTISGVVLVTLIYYLDNQTHAHTRARMLTSCYWLSLVLILALKALVLWKSGSQVESKEYPLDWQIADALGMIQAMLPLCACDYGFFASRRLQEAKGQLDLQNRFLVSC